MYRMGFERGDGAWVGPVGRGRRSGVRAPDCLGVRMFRMHPDSARSSLSPRPRRRRTICPGSRSVQRPYSRRASSLPAEPLRVPRDVVGPGVCGLSTQRRETVQSPARTMGEAVGLDDALRGALTGEPRAYCASVRPSASGGGGRIRTLGGLPHAGFQNRRQEGSQGVAAAILRDA